ncbi:hypothetical protein D9M69_583500 [compost metagenome]
MGHQFVGLLGRGVQRQRMIHTIVHRVRCVLVGAIHRTGRSVDQVFDRVVAAAFEDVQEPAQVAVQVGPGVFQGITHPGLGREVDHDLRFFPGKQCLDGRCIGQVNH